MTISDILTKYDISQAALSRETGIPIRTIENWKAEVRKPPEWAINLIDFYLSKPH